MPNINSYMSVRENTPLNLPPPHTHVPWWNLRTLIQLGIEEQMTVLDYCEEKTISRAYFGQTIFKSRMNDLMLRGKHHIHRGRIDRLFNRLFFQLGQLLPLPPSAISPNRHSFMVVCRKP